MTWSDLCPDITDLSAWAAVLSLYISINNYISWRHGFSTVPADNKFQRLVHGLQFSCAPYCSARGALDSQPLGCTSITVDSTQSPRNYICILEYWIGFIIAFCCRCLDYVQTRCFLSKWITTVIGSKVKARIATVWNFHSTMTASEKNHSFTVYYV